LLTFAGALSKVQQTPITTAKETAFADSELDKKPALRGLFKGEISIVN